MLLVQSFSDRDARLGDFQGFMARLGLRVAPGVLCAPVTRGGVELVVGWVRCALPG